MKKSSSSIGISIVPNIRGQNKKSNKSATTIEKKVSNCGCMATSHPFAGSCMQCGRIMCQKEVEGASNEFLNCLFCGAVIVSACSSEEATLHGFDEMTVNSYRHKDKLLKYDKENAKRTQVHDAQADYYESSTWLTAEEKTVIDNKESQRRTRLHESRSKVTMTLDLSRGLVSVGSSSALPGPDDGAEAEAEAEASPADSIRITPSDSTARNFETLSCRLQEPTASTARLVSSELASALDNLVLLEQRSKAGLVYRELRKGSSISTEGSGRSRTEPRLSVVQHWDEPSLSVESSRNVTSMPKLEPQAVSNRIEGAVLSELATARKLLALQQQDNYKFQEHVTLLDGEIDALKEVVERKQKVINHKQDEILRKDEQIRMLEVELKAAKTDIASFKVVVERNRVLSERLDLVLSELALCKEDLRSYEKNLEETKQFWEGKVTAAVDVEVSLTASVGLLRQEVELLKDKKAASDELIQQLQDRLSILTMELQFSEERRQEEVARSRQTEYKTILKADELGINLQNEKDEKELLQDSLNLALFRGDMLQQRLSSSLTTTTDNHRLMQQVVHTLENEDKAFREREILLKRENESLQVSLELSQRAVLDLVDRLNRVEIHASHVKAQAQASVAAAAASVKQVALKIKASERGGASKKAVFLATSCQLEELSSTSTSAHDASTTNKSVAFSGDAAHAPQKATTPWISPSVRAKTSDSQKKISDDGLRVLVVGDESQHHGKRELLSKYLNLISTDIMLNNQRSIDLAGIGLTDAEMNDVVSFLRTITVKDVERIDLSNNQLTNASLEMLSLWLLAAPSSDLSVRSRSCPLFIDFKYNKVHKRSGARICSLLKSVPRPEISHVSLGECDEFLSSGGPDCGGGQGGIIFAYGVSQLISDSSKTSVVALPSLSPTLRPSSRSSLLQEPAPGLVCKIDLRRMSSQMSAVRTGQDSSPAPHSVHRAASAILEGEKKWLRPVTLGPSTASSLSTGITAGTSATIPRDLLMRTA